MNFDVNRARSNFTFEEGLIFLDHAGHSPLSNPTRAAYEKYFNSWQKTAHRHDSESFKMFEDLRVKLASMINSEPKHIGLAPHTSYGLNIVAAGLKWSKGDNVVISEKEFPSNVYPWTRLRSLGVDINFARSRNGFIDEDAIIDLANERTRVISVSWVQFNNGYRVNLEKLGRFCSENGIIFCVDGIQGMGAVPIDILSAKVDLFSVGCQKWMFGPCGTGFYYLSERAEAAIDPPLQGWLSVDWHAEFSDLMRYDLVPKVGPSKYELGTNAFQDLWALNASVDLLLSFDRDAIWEHICYLNDALISFVSSNTKYSLISSTEQPRRSGIISFKSENSKGLYDYLISKGFALSLREGAIRVSPHFYNSIEEINLLIDSLSDFNS